jgi:transcriptional regulator with XRE-family HTH domain
MLDNQKIGAHIQKLRKRSGLTQAELSNALGVSHQAVSKWENGECLPDLEIVLKLARKFHLSVEQLLLCGSSAEGGVSRDELDQFNESLHANHDDIWEKALQQIRQQISKPSFDTWFKTTSMKRESETFIIYCPNPFSAAWLHSRYASLIRKALEKVTGTSAFKLEFRNSLNDSSADPAIFNLKN